MKEKQYMLMNDQSFGNCKRMITIGDETELLCKLNVPLMANSDGNCMLQLFLHVNIRVDKERDAFVKLGVNEWLCIVAKTELMRVVSSV